MKISDHLVQMFMESEWEDRSILIKEASTVNIRLYKNNPNYRNIILEIVKYMDEHLHTKFEDYGEPRGIAAPSLGFPFKIIGYKKTSGNQFCLNPKVEFVSHNNYTVTTTTNCGSLRLPTNISLERYPTINLEYYDLSGELCKVSNVSRTDASFTIQNAVDQVNGITIIDRQAMTKKKQSVVQTGVPGMAGCGY